MARRNKENKLHLNYGLISASVILIAIILTAASYIFVSLSSSYLHDNAIEQLQYNTDELADVNTSILPTYYNEEAKEIKKTIQSNFLHDHYNELYTLYDSKVDNVIGVGTYSYAKGNTEVKVFSYYFDGTEHEVVINDNNTVNSSKFEDNKISFTNGYNFFTTEEINGLTYTIDNNLIATFFFEKDLVDKQTKIEYTTYFYFLYDLQTLVDSFTDVYSDATYKNMLVLTDSGRLLCSYEETEANNFVDYTNNALNADEFVTNINEQGKYHYRFEIGGRNYYYSASSMLEDYNGNGISLVLIVDGDYVDELNSNLVRLCIAYTIVIAFTFLLIAQILIVVIYNEFFKYHVGKFSLLFVRNYALVVKSNGNIILKNNMFTKNLEIEKKYDNVKDFSIIDEKDIFVPLNEGKSFVARFYDIDGKELLVRFVSIRNGTRYQLVGEKEEKKETNNPVLERLAFMDNLTLLHNLNYVEFEVLDKYIKAGAKGVSVIDVDLKNFKQFTEIFSISFCEDIIKYLARYIKSLVGKETELFSIKRDEFIFIIDNYNYMQNPDVINNIYDQLLKPQTILDNVVNFTPCIGIYNLDAASDRTLTHDIVIDSVRAANRRAHEIVTNRAVYVYDAGLGVSINREVLIEKEIKDGIANDEFVVYFQPQYDIAECKTTGFEALLRWKNSKYMNDSPYEYVRVAEKTGLIVALSDIITRQSFEAARLLLDNGYEDAHISVNVSVAQLVQAGFVADFLKYYDEYHVPYSLISVEVTETMIMGSMEEVSAKLEVLREKGIKIYIDDFGTGYSSLLYLNTLPIDFIKIDREFIKYLQHRKDARLVLSRILQLAKDLEKEVVAEGVETQYQVNFLLKNDCHLIQGWIISKAQPKDRILDLMKVNRDLRNEK